MKRREFITLLGGAAAAWPLAARAQQGERMRRIGMLMSLAADDPESSARLTAFVRGLQELGWSDGRNVRIDIRWSAGVAEEFRKYAAELVALAPDTLVAVSTPSVAALQHATRTVPIVFVQVVDPVGSGFVETLARPGGNATGFTVSEYSISGKWMELLKEIAPGTTRAVVLRDPSSPVGIGQFGALQAVAASSGMELRPADVRDAGEIERAITALARGSNVGLAQGPVLTRLGSHTIRKPARLLSVILLFCGDFPREPSMGSRAAVSLVACVLFACMSHGTARSAELKIFASRAIWTVLAEIGPEFEKSSGHKLNVITGLSPEFVGRINAGETFDVIAAPPAVLDGLIKNGKIAADSKTNLARSAYGVVVRTGAPKPDISSVEAFKRALLNAKSITYLPVPGVPQLIERLGLKDAIASKVTIPNTDISSELVAKGEVELAIVVITQTFTTPGVELAGPLPSEIQFDTNFGGAVSATSRSADAARDLLIFLKKPTAIGVIRAQGMEPI
jgi:ABC-type molybdate transport system substrate-binding protein